MLDELKEKLERMHESIAEATELDLTKFPAQYIPHGNWHRVQYDLHGGWTPTKVKRAANGIIRDIADLKDYFASAARNAGYSTEIVDGTVRECFELQLIIDLANRDKHSSHGRKTWSGKFPRLRDVKRVVELSGKAEPGKFIGLRLGSRTIEGFGGKTAVAVSADIVDRNGEHLSTLLYAQKRAIEAWESLLKKIGLDS